MSFKFYCDCGQKVSATEDMIGTRAVCPNCHTLLTVPALEQPAPPTSVRPAPPLPVVPDAPRPTALLSRLALVSLSLVVAGGVWGIRGQDVPLLPAISGVVIGIFLGSMLGAIFLRLAVKIVARFDLPFSEATYFCIITYSISLLSLLPLSVLVPLHSPQNPSEQLQHVVSLVGSINVLFTLACFAYLIRDYSGRPLGWGKGVLSYLLEIFLIGLFVGVLAGAFLLASRYA